MRPDVLPRHAVTRIDVLNRIVPAKAVAVHNALHQAANIQKADLILQKQPHGLLVGAVGGAGAKAALADGFFGCGQAAEGLLIRHVKAQLVQRGKIQLRDRAFQPVGPG